MTIHMHEIDTAKCQVCEHIIGTAPSVEAFGGKWHRDCLPPCPMCGDGWKEDDEPCDPSREPFRLLDFAVPCHIECCREAAWNSLWTRRSDDDDYNRATGRLGGGRS